MSVFRSFSRCALWRSWLLPFVRLFFSTRTPRPRGGSPSSAAWCRHDFDFVWGRDAW